jgi:hypothetical protein
MKALTRSTTPLTLLGFFPSQLELAKKALLARYAAYNANSQQYLHGRLLEHAFLVNERDTYYNRTPHMESMQECYLALLGHSAALADAWYAFASETQITRMSLNDRREHLFTLIKAMVTEMWINRINLQYANEPGFIPLESSLPLER